MKKWNIAEVQFVFAISLDDLAKFSKCRIQNAKKNTYILKRSKLTLKERGFFASTGLYLHIAVKIQMVV